MPVMPADTPPAAPDQMPAAPNTGPAPVPYNGPAMALAPGTAGPEFAVSVGVPAEVLATTTGNAIQRNPLAAPNVNPYETSSIDPGDGQDDVAATVAASVAAAEARFTGRETETHAQGSVIGDPMVMPPRTAGGNSDGGGFYD